MGHKTGVDVEYLNHCFFFFILTLGICTCLMSSFFYVFIPHQRVHNLMNGSPKNIGWNKLGKYHPFSNEFIFLERPHLNSFFVLNSILFSWIFQYIFIWGKMKDENCISSM